MEYQPTTSETLQDCLVEAKKIITTLHGSPELQVQVERLTHLMNNVGETLEAVQREFTLHEAIEAEAFQRASQLQLINRISRQITAVHDLNALFQQVVTLVQQTFDYHHVALFLVDGDDLHLKALSGAYRNYFPNNHVQQQSVGINGWVASQGEILIVNDVSRDDRYLSLIPDYTITRSEMCLPILVQGKTIGVLDIQSPRLNSFTKNDSIAMMTLCDQVAVAYQNARLYQALDQKIALLARSNQELQEFAYVASHDLQEPLRKIQAFGERLSSRYQTQLDKMGLDYLERMQSAASRGRELIQNLLTYSRVTTQGQPFKQTDLNHVLQRVINDLELQITDVSGRVEVAELPTVMADVSQMVQLFQNLIGNALKFHRPYVPPIIEITASQTEPERYQIAIADNGIGIESQYIERIFAPFQRLHTRNQYAGTGIGLAICRKIVQRHQGEIWAVGQLGVGTTFFVNLPLSLTETDD